MELDYRQQKADLQIERDAELHAALMEESALRKKILLEELEKNINLTKVASLAVEEQQAKAEEAKAKLKLIILKSKLLDSKLCNSQNLVLGFILCPVNRLELTWTIVLFASPFVLDWE
uniref:Uncharacterized protein n=1 Tax=Cacopsylla melanoneura TaxID=428564 RepID=A0A8D9B8P2_9HEMI